jgi:hypothetical protein
MDCADAQLTKQLQVCQVWHVAVMNPLYTPSTSFFIVQSKPKNGTAAATVKSFLLATRHC